MKAKKVTPLMLAKGMVQSFNEANKILHAITWAELLPFNRQRYLKTAARLLERFDVTPKARKS